MSKDIEKNRKALIRHLYSLPKPNRAIQSHHYNSGPNRCLCVKGETMAKFFGLKIHPFYDDGTLQVNRIFSLDETYIDPELESILEMDVHQWKEMEYRYEGIHHPRHNFSQIADWLQTLPNWPTVL